MRATFLVANYNYSKYLEESLEAMKNQTYQCSICFIDDASTDNSLEIACSSLGIKDLYVEQDYLVGKNNNYKVIALNKNSGPSFARNTGIMATLNDTDIYVIADADDVPYKNKVERLIPYFNDPNIAVVYGDYDIYNVERNTLIREFKERYSYAKLQKECIIHSQALIRKDALLKTAEPTGFYDINLTTCEDFDLWLRIADQYMIYHCPESFTLVRTHNNSSVNYRSSDEWKKNWQTVYLKNQKRHEKRSS